MVHINLVGPRAITLDIVMGYLHDVLRNPTIFYAEQLAEWMRRAAKTR